MEPFARTIDAAKKYVVSGTMDRVDWNAELMRGDLGKAVQPLKLESGKGLLMGGVSFRWRWRSWECSMRTSSWYSPGWRATGRRSLAGQSKRAHLKLVSRLEFGSEVVAMRYEPRSSSPGRPNSRVALLAAAAYANSASTIAEPRDNTQ